MLIVDGSLLNLLDAVADSQSTEVPYRVGGKPIQSIMSRVITPLKADFLPARSFMLNCAAGSLSVTTIL